MSSLNPDPWEEKSKMKGSDRFHSRPMSTPIHSIFIYFRIKTGYDNQPDDYITNHKPLKDAKTDKDETQAASERATKGKQANLDLETIMKF